MKMTDLQAYLLKLNENLQILQRREAGHGGNAPLDLLNQIADHKQAIALTRQAMAGAQSEAELREALKPLLVSLNLFGDFFASVPRIPRQRPPRAQHFTDRETELARLLAELQPGRVVTLCGPGGIGKTALAAEAVAQLPPDRFPDGIIFHSFYGKPDPALAFEHIVRSFDETARDTSDDAARRALAGRRLLLILDGTEDAADLAAVLQVRGQCGVIVTSPAQRRCRGRVARYEAVGY
jgi:hypothetical protein